MQQKELKYFGDENNARLNSDDADILIGVNEWVNAENIRIATTDAGVTSIVQSIGATILKSEPQPSVTFITIGAAEDLPNNRVINFKFNTTGTNHKITAYSRIANTEYDVILSSQVNGGLNFDKNHIIHSAKVVNGVVYWTDNLNEIRMVIIDAGIKLNNPAYQTTIAAYTIPIEQSVITLIRRPPFFAIQSIAKGVDAGFAGNFIANDSFQFTTRYRYRNNEESVLGQWSKLVPANFPTDTFNKIDISITYINNNVSELSINQDVDEIDLIVRFGNEGGSFIIKTFKNLNHSGSITLNYTFYNNQIGIPVDLSVASNISDSVPRLAEGLEFADGRLFTSNNLNGYNTPSATSLSISVTYNPPFSISVPLRVIKSNSKRQFGVGFFDDYGRPCGGVVTNDTLFISTVNAKYFNLNNLSTIADYFNWALSNDNALIEIPEQAASYQIYSTKDLIHLNVIQGISSAVRYYDINQTTNLYEHRSPTFDITKKVIGIDISFLIQDKKGYVFTEGDVVRLYYENGTTIVFNDFKIIGQGGTQIFVDALQLSTNLPNGDTSARLFWFEIYTPFPAAIEQLFYGTGDVFKILSPGTSGRLYSQLTGTIIGDVFITQKSYDKFSPIFGYAHGEKIVVTAGGNIGNEIPLVDISGGSFNAPHAPSSYPNNYCDIPFGFIDIDSGYFTITNQPIVTALVFRGNWKRIEFKNPIAADMDTSVQMTIQYRVEFDASVGVPPSKYKLDLEVRKYVVGGGSYQVMGYKTLTEADGFIGETIIEAERFTLANGQYLRFVTRLQVINNNGALTAIAKVFFSTNKNSTLKLTSPNDDSIYTTHPVIFLSEEMNPSEVNWSRWERDLGKVSVITDLGEIRNKNEIRWSNTLIEGTQINGLSSFEEENHKEIDSRCGTIRKILYTSKANDEQGGVMLIICEKQWASLYIGEVQQYDANKSTNLAVTTSVAGTINILKGDFGTINPESAIQYRGNVYCLDMNNGKYIQYSSNGLFPISDIKMTRFWKQFCDQFKSMTTAEIEALGSRPFVFSTVDPHHNELLISIPKLLEIPPKGYMPDDGNLVYPFDIWDGKGKTIVYSLNKEPHYWLGSYSFNPEFFITLGSELYSFRQGHLYLHNSTVNFNNFYGIQYDSKIMFVSNMLPNIPKAYDSLGIESNTRPSLVYFFNDYPYQQCSDLVDFSFKDLEGIFYANILRNKLVPTATGYNTNGLLTAEKLRATALKIMLQFPSITKQLQLKFVNINFNTSIGHKV